MNASSIPRQRRPYSMRVPPAPPLTREQAQEIVDASGIPSDSLQYKPFLIGSMVDISKNESADKRRYVSQLVNLAKNPCSKESVTGTLNNLKKSLEAKKTEDPDITDLDLAAITNSVLYSLALLLAVGFDEVDKANLVFDGNGNLIDVRDAVRSRMPICDAYLNTKKWRVNPDVDYAGKRRKTLKKRKSKKQLSKSLKKRVKHVKRI